MKPNTDKEKATVRQKAPDKTQMDKMIQRSKDYGLKVAAPNMKTDTQTAERPSEAEITRLAGLQAAKTHKWNGWDWKAYQTSITRQNHHISKIEAQADKLAEALRHLLAISHNANASQYKAATATLAEYEAAR